MINDRHSNSAEPQYAVYFRRWVVLFFFALLCIANSIPWMSYSAIFSAASSHYSIGSNAINLLSIIYMVIAALTQFPAVSVTAKLGMRNGLVLSAWLNFLGCVLKIVCEAWNVGYWPILLCQILCALSAVLFLAAPAQLAGLWFPENERATATMIGSVSVMVGASLGFLIPPVVLKMSPPVWGFMNLYILEAVIACVGYLGIWFFVPEKPEKPPGITASSFGDNDMSLLSDIAMAYRCDGFLSFSISSGGILGVTWSASSLLGQLTSPWKMSDQLTGWCGFANILCGVCMSFYIGSWIDKNRKYRSIGTNLCFLTAVTLLLLLLGLEFIPNETAIIVLTFTFYVISGFFLTGEIAVLMELGVELTFPVNEMTSSAIILVNANVITIVLTIGAGFFLEDAASLDDMQYRAKLVWGVMILVLAICAQLLRNIEPNYRRLEHEQKSLIC